MGVPRHFHRRVSHDPTQLRRSVRYDESSGIHFVFNVYNKSSIIRATSSCGGTYALICITTEYRFDDSDLVRAGFGVRLRIRISLISCAVFVCSDGRLVSSSTVRAVTPSTTRCNLAVTDAHERTG
jgi:hypothetical protein